MRREVFGVVEAARSLQVVLAPTEANARGIRLGCSRAELPERLWRVAKSLETFDRAGASAMGSAQAGSDPAMDAARLRVALDGVFRWMRSTGLDIAEPHALVSQALGAAGPDAKQPKGYKPVPRFAPNGFGKARRPSPLLRLDPAPGETVSLGGLAAKETQARATEATMGAAAPRTGRRR